MDRDVHYGVRPDALEREELIFSKRYLIDNPVPPDYQLRIDKERSLQLSKRFVLVPSSLVENRFIRPLRRYDGCQ
jgi:hypothetical protein